jgi:hypothetical protein
MVSPSGVASLRRAEERVERAQAVVAGEHLDLVGIRRCG